MAFATGRGLSQRRACTLVKVGRSALRYRSRKAEKDAPVLARMSELAAQYPRYGYRRVRIFLGRDGHKMSFGRAYRLWQAGEAAGAEEAAAQAHCQRAGRVRRRRRGPTRCGATTSCSTGAPTASSSSA